MKLKMNLLAGAAILSVVSFPAWGQAVAIVPAPVKDGSNASRAPLPVNRPNEYNVVVKDGTWATAANSTVAARHIGGTTPDQLLAAETTDAPAAQIYATTAAEPVLTPTGRTAVAAGASLDASQMGSQIRSDATVSRNQLAEIESRVAASNQSMAATRDTMPVLNADAQTQLNSANNDVKEKEQALRQSIKAARNTTAEQVAADYEAYAAAVARVDSLASAQP